MLLGPYPHLREVRHQFIPINRVCLLYTSESGKPEAIQEKMAIGRLEKFFKGIVLNEQEFIKDSSMTIKAYAEKVSKELGDTIKVVAFDRLVCGE